MEHKHNVKIEFGGLTIGEALKYAFLIFASVVIFMAVLIIAFT